MVCHYWFFNHGFKFQNFFSNGCHDLVYNYYFDNLVKTKKQNKKNKKIETKNTLIDKKIRKTIRF